MNKESPHHIMSPHSLYCRAISIRCPLLPRFHLRAQLRSPARARNPLLPQTLAAAGNSPALWVATQTRVDQHIHPSWPSPHLPRSYVYPTLPHQLQNSAHPRYCPQWRYSIRNWRGLLWVWVQKRQHWLATPTGWLLSPESGESY